MKKNPEKIRQALQQRKQNSLYRQPLVAESAQQPLRKWQGRQVLSFSSNDYLGLANHAEMVRCLQQAAGEFGVGSGAAHLLGGHTLEHELLEEELAAFVGRDRALLFSTGYMANLGVIQALLERGDYLFQDRLNHASLLDAGILSRANMVRYPHNAIDRLERKLQRHAGKNCFIVSDGVFSMDGDVANAKELARLAEQYDAWLMIDDAHGLGVLGKNGGGLLEDTALSQQQVPLLMGTLGKALGGFGAFVAGDADVIDYIRQQARSWIYTTAPPAAIAAAVRCSLRLTVEEAWRREKLQKLVSCFRREALAKGMVLGQSATPIQTLMLGSNSLAAEVSAALWQENIYVAAIRSPTVPEGTARLRITLTASHELDDVERLIAALAKVLGEGYLG